MEVDLRAPGIKLPRGHITDLARRVRAAFERLAHRIARVIVRMAPDEAARRAGTRQCVIEIHMADGHVERVQERQRRLGAALQRALKRGWQMAARWVAAQLTRRRDVLRLPAAPRPLLLAAPVRPDARLGSSRSPLQDRR
jgi:hypothetical protein